MPEITIQQTTFERLQRHAKPFTDTPDSVINIALDALEQNGNGDIQIPGGRGNESERKIDPRALPNLTHTKVLRAMYEEDQIKKPNWNHLLDEMLIRAMKRVGSFEKLQQYCPVNMVEGRKEDEGYGYLPDINISVQGQDANGACRAILTAAQGLGIPIDIQFMWRQKESASFPGERARILITGKK